MTININLRTFFAFLFCMYLVCSYPLHWYMMSHEVGWYNNDPNLVWHDGSEEKRGPSTGYRMCLLIASPVVVPLDGVYVLAKRTTEQLGQGTGG